MDGGWIDDLLGADDYASGIPGGVDCRRDDVTGPAMDEADGAEREPCRDRLSARLQVSAARSRYKILRGIRWDPGGGRNQGREIAAAEPQSEFEFGAVASIGKRGVPVENDIVR